MADKALLAGINDYQSISDLRGCENDVRSIEQLLTQQFGLLRDNVQKLYSRDVTKERIQRGWDWLLGAAAPGDRLVFHFSGHGSYTTDLDDDEPDGVDELLCLYDMDWDDPQTYLLDDELRAFTERLPRGVFLTVILDSCHSGTGTRMLMAPTATRGLAHAAGPRKQPLVELADSLARMGERSGTRSLSLAGENVGGTVQQLLDPRGDDERAKVLARYVEPPARIIETLHRRGVRGSFRAPYAARDAEMNHVLLAGSLAKQTSADAYISGDYHGAFTYYLCETARAGGANLDHQELIRRLRATLSGNHFSQVPQLEPEGTRGPLFHRSEHGQPAAPPSSPHADVGDLLAQLIRQLEELLRRRQAEARAQPAAAGHAPLAAPAGVASHADFRPSLQEKGVFGDAAAKLQQSLAAFAQNLGGRLTRFVDDVTTLEVSTYACEQMQPGAQDPPPQLRARTTIKPDGDTDVCVPRETGQIDGGLWKIHLETVKQAQQNRAEMLAAVVSAATGLMNVLKP